MSFGNKLILLNFQSLSVVANREMAFLHAITTAGILQEIVSQCAANKIAECNCNKTAWQSHACKKNILDFAVKQTKILTRSKTQGNDEQNKIDQSHKKEGIKVNDFFIIYVFVYWIEFLA